MHDYLNHLQTDQTAPVRGNGFAAANARSNADMIITGLIWCIPAALAMISLFLMSWFLMAASACTAKNTTCAADPTIGLWVMTLGGIVSFVIGTAMSFGAARRGRPMFPGAIVGTVLVLATWLAGAFLMTT
ncbi:hypothetical protein [Nocardia callitridis]|uniref:Uncharacterized protein n=1 Tax=Nocardia callitridis TaxID=648753 RepID=A0ABP9K6G7_9NOCA